ncbi:MAG: RNA polymerase sigma factor [Lewinellaceae bacterium]|nr:RNA polymerase sigma factor [Lewinellaceae bacterium]
MKRHQLSESELVRALSGTNLSARQAALRQLFEHSAFRQKTMAHVRHYGGNVQDGEDVFQESLLVLDRKLREGAFQGEGSLEAYFMGIVRWHWFNEFQRRKRKATISMETPPEPPPGGNPEQEYLLNEQKDQLETLLQLLTEKCRSILKMYQLDYSMEEIAEAMGYANAGVAKKEAHLCRERFRALLKKNQSIWQALVKRTQS